jgi:hypothetical protein
MPMLSLLDALAEARPALVGLPALALAVGCDDADLATQLAEAEKLGTVEIWTCPRRGPCAILSAVEANRRGLELYSLPHWSAGECRWCLRGHAPRERASGRPVVESVLAARTGDASGLDGLVDARLKGRMNRLRSNPAARE